MNTPKDTDKSLRRRPLSRSSVTRAVSVGFALVACWIATGCNDAVAPAARPVPVTPVLRKVEPLASVQGLLAAKAGTILPMTSYPFYEQVLVEASISGLLHITSDPGASAVKANDVDFDYTGIRDFSLNQCDWAATIYSPQLSSPGFNNCPSGVPVGSPRYSGRLEWRDTILLGGVGGNEFVSARRGGGSGDPPDCPLQAPACNCAPSGAVCHTVTNLQTITLNPLPATINLTTNATLIAPKTIMVPDPYSLPVTFTVSTIPTSYHGIAVPRKALSWQWIPAAGGYSDSRVCAPPPVNSNSYSCGAYIYERGSVIVNARVNGTLQSDTIKVVGKQIRILPDSDRMLFSVLQWKLRTPHGTVRDTIKRIPSTQKLLISVIDTADHPIPNQMVSLSLTAHDSTGGHLHASGAPAGSLDVATINTGATGIRAVYFTAPRTSGIVTVRGLSGTVHGSRDIPIGLFTLIPLPPGNYDTTGAHAGQHIQNHYATPNHIQKLTQFAEWYLARYSRRALFNDSSLPLGGLYDYQSTWEQPHAAHGEGRATDFETGGLDATTIWIIGDKIEHITGVTPGNETQEANHFHFMTKN